jgi:hypothetical protein
MPSVDGGAGISTELLHFLEDIRHFCSIGDGAAVDSLFVVCIIVL